MFLTFNFLKYLDKATLEPMESPSGLVRNNNYKRFTC